MHNIKQFSPKPSSHLFHSHTWSSECECINRKMLLYSSVQFIKRYSSLGMDNLKWNLSEWMWAYMKWQNIGQTNVVNLRRLMARSSDWKANKTKSTFRQIPFQHRASRNKRSCGKAIVVNNNAKWFKSDDGGKKVYVKTETGGERAAETENMRGKLS